jgi:hypothetical protein
VVITAVRERMHGGATRRRQGDDCGDRGVTDEADVSPSTGGSALAADGPRPRRDRARRGTVVPGGVRGGGRDPHTDTCRRSPPETTGQVSISAGWPRVRHDPPPDGDDALHHHRRGGRACAPGHPRVTAATFNTIDVDGETSPNDSSYASPTDRRTARSRRARPSRGSRRCCTCCASAWRS